MTHRRRAFGLWLVGAIVLCMLITCLTTGCAVKLDGNGTMGFEQQTKWGFYHTTQKNDPLDNATAELDVKALLDYLKSQDAAEPADGAN